MVEKRINPAYQISFLKIGWMLYLKMKRYMSYQFKNDSTKHTNDQGPASDQNAPFKQDIDGESTCVLLLDPVVNIPDKIEIMKDFTNEKSID